MGVISKEAQEKRKKGFETILGYVVMTIPIAGDLLMAFLYLILVGATLRKSNTIIVDLLLNTMYLALFYAGLVIALTTSLHGKLDFGTYLFSVVLRVPVLICWQKHMYRRQQTE